MKKIILVALLVGSALSWSKNVVASMASLSATAVPRTVQLPLTLTLDKEKIQGGERFRGRATRSGDTSQPVTLRLESTQPNLIVVPKSDVVINRGETVAVFELISVPTPIKTTVSIRAFLPSLQVPAIRSIEVYPAILKSVTLNNPSLPGTRGGKIGVRVELNANAPVGGIELYLNLTGV